MLKAAIWAQKKTVIYTMIAGTIGGLTAVALFAQSGYLISKAALMPPFYVILILAAFLKLFGVAKSTSKYAERLLSHEVTFHLMSRVRESYFAKLLQQTSLFYRHQSGDLLHRVTSDVETLQNYFLRVAYPPLVAGAVFLATILFTLIFSWQMALVLMIGYILCAFAIPYVFAKLTTEEALPLKQELSSKTTEYLYGYETLQHYNQLDRKTEQLLALSKQYGERQSKYERLQHIAQGANQFIAFTAALSVLLIGATAVTNGELQGVFLAMLLMVTLTVFELATPLANMPSFVAETNAATARLDDVTVSVGGQETVSSILPIQFEHVTFQYPTALSPALNDVTLTIERGDKIAIIGESGSGKTSMLHMLLKELPVQQGQLTLNGVSITKLADDSLFKQMSVQLQHNHFFIGTVKENLQLAKPHANDAEMEAVLKEVQLPFKLDDPIHEKALNLSGGERQRLAYARVLLQNAPTILLDEPFANIDALLKQKLTQALCARDNTVLMITHDTDNLSDFDAVYKMAHGKFLNSKSKISHNYPT